MPARSGGTWVTGDGLILGPSVLKQVDAKCTDEASHQRRQPYCQLRKPPARSWRFPFHEGLRYSSSQLLNSLLLVYVAIYAGFKRCLQRALITFGESEESKGLLSAGERHKHFCRAYHGSPVRFKRQLNPCALVHSAWQKQQAAVARDDVQFARKAETVLELKKSVSCIGDPESRDAPVVT